MKKQHLVLIIVLIILGMFIAFSAAARTAPPGHNPATYGQQQIGYTAPGTPALPGNHA